MAPELTHRQRVRLALDHQATDRVPIALVCSGLNPPAHRALEAWLARERGLSVGGYLAPLLDIRGVEPAYIGPPRPPRTDIWGVRRAPVSYGAGTYDEIEHYPLAGVGDIGDLDRYPWPSPDWFDYDGLPARIAAIEAEGDYCLMAANGNIFESAWYMRGFEHIFEDLALDPELAGAIFERVCDFFTAYFGRLLAAARGRIDLVFTADDIAGQNGLLMSLPMWERHLKPHHARLNAVIHGYGAKVIYHSDGAVMAAVPGLLEMGIDVLQALQFDAAGMDPARLKADYGDRLCFQGGVSVQSTLPFGTPEQVRAEVVERIAVLGRHGGYILGPSHAIQAGTPPENIAAMFDEAARER
jgi:uroporphyrinogen decarboxylase